ncbi:hypothetical protein F4811DRAFT_554953 [Daldinia bambusicola]|nr:hypothetical protein F4811DRAFT_554953 [Daldinia bambusicola]
MYNVDIILATFLFASVAAAQSLPPSPTASVGCHPHGDHWHCDGPASSTSSATPSGTGSGEVSQTLAPSPTESVGSHSHGDHWHCDGPAVTESTSSAEPVETGGVGKVVAGNAVILGGLFVVAAMGL